MHSLLTKIKEFFHQINHYIKNRSVPKPCIASMLDSSDDVSQNIDLYKQRTPSLKM